MAMASTKDQSPVRLSQYPIREADPPTPTSSTTARDLEDCPLWNTDSAQHRNLEELAVPTILPDPTDLRSYPVSHNQSGTKPPNMKVEATSATYASGHTKSEHSSPARSQESGSDSQLIDLSLVQKSYEPRYSPPNSSAVSSTLVSPVMASFDRPRRLQSGYFDADGDEETYLLDAGSEVSESEKEYSGVTISRYSSADISDDEEDKEEEGDCGESRLREWAPNGSINDSETQDNILLRRDYTDLPSDRTSDGVDDAEDVMNPSEEYGGGIVVPHIHGVPSVDGEELEKIICSIPKRLDVLSQNEGIANPFSSTYSTLRRASSPTGQPESPFVSREPFQKSSGNHIQFDSGVSAQDTPFAKTLKYFKQLKDKENTPSKSRRNASLPEEIAELAKAAQQDGIEEEHAMWKTYRELDFAPEDPVMEAGLAGDLIMTGTPTKQPVRTMREDHVSKTSLRDDEQMSRVTTEDTGTIYEVSIPGHYDDAFRLRFRSTSPIQQIASYIRQRCEELEASKEEIDHVVQSFLACPAGFVVRDLKGEHDPGDDTLLFYEASESIPVPLVGTQFAGNDIGENKDGCDKQLILYQEDPVFVRIIGMLPQAMFWAVAQPIAHYGNKAFDAVMYKLAELSLEGSEATA